MPFYKTVPEVNQDVEKGEWSRCGTEEFDAADNVLVAVAHDEYLLEVLDFFPKTLNGWKEKEDGVRARWLFSKGLGRAVEMEGKTDV
jgi:hypothetical protein